jgi:YVTN family beta-propeller protein
MNVWLDPVNHIAYAATLDNTLHAIDIATGTQTAAIPAGNDPAAFTVDPATGTIYVGNLLGGTITVIDGTANTVTQTISLPRGDNANSLVFDPATGLLYAWTQGAGIISIDPASGAVAEVVQNSSQRTSLTLDAQHHVLYAAPEATNAVQVIDLTTQAITRTFPVLVDGFNATFSLDATGSTLYVASNMAVASYATSSGQMDSQTLFSEDQSPAASALDTATGTLYKSEYDSIAQVNGATLAVTGTIPITLAGVAAVDDATGTLICATNFEGAQVVLIHLTAASAITSAAATTFRTGSAGTFTVTAPGTPAATFTETGRLPAGVQLSAAGTLSGTPKAGTGGTYRVTITASNGLGSPATQQFTLTAGQPAAITSANHATFTHGRHGSFTIRATGFPTATLKETGALPSGLKFTPASNGTATISGTPASSAKGKTFTIHLSASNGVGATTVQRFTLTVS